MKVKVAESCPILCDPMDCSLPGSSVHEIFQARILKWISILFSRGFSWPRAQTQVSCIASRCFTIWATREAQECSNYSAIALISHSSKVMLKIFQATLQQYMNWELPDVQARFRKGWESEMELPTFIGWWRKQGSFRKSSTSVFTDYGKAFDWVGHNKLKNS